jgi:hypothetical protein
MVGSADTRVEAENTVKTLKSYESISKMREVPVVACYYENSTDTPRGTVDVQVRTAVMVISAIFSGDNHELDSSDLSNFLNYSKVTSYPSKLSQLDFFSGNIILQKNRSLITLVTLSLPGEDTAPGFPVEYQAVGFTTPATLEVIDIQMPIHAAVIAGAFNEIITNLDKKIKAVNEARSSHVEKSILTHDDTSTSDGLVL